MGNEMNELFFVNKGSPVKRDQCWDILYLQNAGRHLEDWLGFGIETEEGQEEWDWWSAEIDAFDLCAHNVAPNNRFESKIEYAESNSCYPYLYYLAVPNTTGSRLLIAVMEPGYGALSPDSHSPSKKGKKSSFQLKLLDYKIIKNFGLFRRFSFEGDFRVLKVEKETGNTVVYSINFTNRRKISVSKVFEGDGGDLKILKSDCGVGRDGGLSLVFYTDDADKYIRRPITQTKEVKN